MHAGIHLYAKVHAWALWHTGRQKCCVWHFVLVTSPGPYLTNFYPGPAGAAEHRKLVEAPAPASASDMHHHKAWAQAPGPAGAEEEHDWQTDADMLFILSADQVRGCVIGVRAGLCPVC